MKKQIAKLTIVNLLAVAILAIPALCRAQDATSTNAPAVAPETTPEATPTMPEQTTNAPVVKKVRKHDHSVGSGKVSEVDTNAMTLTIGKRTFDITSETRINKDGEPAVLSDIAVGDKVGVSYKKTTDGKLNATTINDGKKSKDEEKQ